MQSKKTIEQIASDDGRYQPQAIQFVYEGLGYTVRTAGVDSESNEPRHVKGPELCYGIGQLARQKWGRMAKVVLNSWGLNSTRDFGEIVYIMIENHWMSAQSDDKLDDFDDVYDFEQFFEKHYKLDIVMQEEFE